MKKTLQLVALFICVVLGLSAQAAVKYWDIDGTTAGAGGATPAGTWNDTTGRWNDDSTGGAGGTITTWVANGSGTDTAVFSAGTDATGTFTVTVGPSYQVGFQGIVFEEGTVTVRGQTLGATAYATLFPVNTAGVDSTIEVQSGAAGILQIANPNVAGNIIKTGPGKLTLAGIEANGGFGDASGSYLKINEGAWSVDVVTIQTINGSAESKFGRARDIYLGTGSTGGTLEYTGATATMGTHGTYGTSLIIGGAGGGTVDVTTGATTLTLNRPVTGTGPFTKAGPGTLQFNAAGTYTGDTTVSAGTLRLNVASAIPSGSGNGDVSVTGTLDLSTLGATINGLSGSGTVIGASTLTVGADNDTTTFSGNIGSGGIATGLTKTGSGSLTLTGSSATTGNVTVSGGSLLLSGSGAVSSAGTVAIGSGATLDVSGVSSPPYSVASGKTLAGSGATGTVNGSLTLDSGANFSLAYNTNNGATLNVPSGTVTFNDNPTTITVSGGALGSGANYTLVSQSGGTVAGSAAGALVIGGDGITGGGSPSLTISGGQLVLNISAAASLLNWGPSSGTWAVGVAGWGSGGATMFADGDTVAFDDVYASGNQTITLDTVVAPANVLVTNATVSEYTITGTGTITGFSGASALIKAGTGTLTVAVPSTIPAGAVLTAGQLNVNHSAALGASTSPLTIVGGALGNTSGNSITVANNNAQNWNADFSFEGTSDLNLGSGAVSLGAARTVTVNANNLTVGGVIGDGASTYSLTKAGSGTLTLSGANTFDGDTRIGAGVLTLANSSALQNSTLDMNSLDTGTLSFGGLTAATAGHVKGSRSITLDNDSSAGVTLTVGGDGASQTYTGSLSGNGNLTKVGSGTLNLDNAGQTWTHSGGTTVSEGTLRFNISLTVGSGDFTVNGIALNEGRTVTVNGFSGSGTLTSGGSFDHSKWVVGNNNASSTFTGQITRSPAKNSSLNKIGTGTLRLSGLNTIGAGTGSDVTFGVHMAANSGRIVAAHGDALGAYRCDVGSGSTLEIANVAMQPSLSLVLTNGSTLIGSGGTVSAYGKTGFPSIVGVGTVTIGTALSTDQLTITTAITGSDTGSIINAAGPGLLVLNSGSATGFAGKWDLSGGTLRIGDVNSLGATGTKGITLSGGTLETRVSAAGQFSTATVVSGNSTIMPNQANVGADHNYGTLSINGSTLSVGPGSQITSGTEIATFGATTLTGSPTINVTNNGAVNMTVVLGAVGQSGTRSLTKTGAGKLEITGTGSYTGNTTVSAGTLALSGSGSIGSSAIISVAAGATLDASARTDGTLALGASQTLTGSGTVAGILSVSGTVAPGSSIGELDTGNQTWNSAGVYNWEVSNVAGAAGTDWDHLNVTGDLTVAATTGSRFVVNVLPTVDGGTITGLDKDTSTTWTIATVSGTVNSLSSDKFTVNDTAVTNDLAGGWFFVGEGSVTLTYTNNHAPTASAATYTRYSGSSLKIPIANLLATYSADPDGQARTLTLLNSGANANQSANGYTITTNASYILYTNISDATTDTIDFVVVDQANYRAWDTKKFATNTITINTEDSIGSVTVTNSGGGNLTIGFHGIPNYGYVIQRSDTVDFSGTVDEILTTNAPSNGMFEYTETPPYNPAFYRIRSQ